MDTADMMPIVLPPPSSMERLRLLSADAAPHRILQRLYRRKAVVDRLIRSLEEYAEAVESPLDPGGDLTAGPK